MFCWESTLFPYLNTQKLTDSQMMACRIQSSQKSKILHPNQSNRACRSIQWGRHVSLYPMECLVSNWTEAYPLVPMGLAHCSKHCSSGNAEFYHQLIDRQFLPHQARSCSHQLLMPCSLTHSVHTIHTHYWVFTKMGTNPMGLNNAEQNNSIECKHNMYHTINTSI